MKVVYAYVAGIKSFPSQGEVSIDLRLPIESVGEVTSLLFQHGPGRAAFILPANQPPGGAEEGSKQGYGVHYLPDQGPLGVLSGGETGQNRAEKGTAHPETEANQPLKRPIGPRCLRAVELCRDPTFQRFLATCFNTPVNSEQTAAQLVRSHCDVISRRDFDDDKTNTAWAQWRAIFEIPYEKFLATRGRA